MKKLFVNVICAFIPSKKLRVKIREKLLRNVVLEKIEHIESILSSNLYAINKNAQEIFNKNDKIPERINKIENILNANTKALETLLKDNNYYDVSMGGGSVFSLRKSYITTLIRTNSWEHHTFAVFKKYINEDTVYLDIGGHVGMTCLIAKVNNAKKIHAVEINPDNIAVFKDNMQRNYVDVSLYEYAIFNKNDETVSFEIFKNHSVTGASKIIDTDTTTADNKILIKVNTITLPTLLEKHNISPNFIKIDIEGSERFILNDLFSLEMSNLKIYLSLHVSFWDKPTRIQACQDILKFYEKFDVYLHENIEEKLPLETLEMMMLTEEETPSWSEHGGNLFTLLLVRKY
ncbi:MAG: FkbM family methyltransferase [Alphaproteobacteria bacterium]|nr:FkbM family methyltransferase [Alphaproteobacteria bacterium]